MPGTVADARLAGKTAVALPHGRALARRSRGRVLRGARMARTIPAMVAFDTLKASRRLRDAGFEEKQANALVNAFAEDIGANLATKDDLVLLRKDMAGEFAAVRQEMASENAALRQEMASEFGAVRQEIKALESRMTSENEALRKEMALRDERTAERMEAMEERTGERMKAMEERTAERMKAMEERTGERMKAMEERMNAREERQNARSDRQATRFTLIVAGLAGLILTAIGIATGVLATL